MPNKINPLIVIPSPRDIGVIAECIDNLDYDKLWMKDNFNELEAYEVLRNYFLEHTEYTHMVILPDDLLVPISAFERLVSDLEKKDYPVLSGICNFNCEKIGTERRPGTYDLDLAVDYNHSMGREYILQNEVPNHDHYSLIGKMKGIKKVAFAGFSLGFIRRDVVEKVQFGSKGRGIDADFSVKLLIQNIDQYVDFEARSLHLKGIENCENIGCLMEFQFDNSINSSVNQRRDSTPKLVFQAKGTTDKQEIDYIKYK